MSEIDRRITSFEIENRNFQKDGKKVQQTLDDIDESFENLDDTINQTSDDIDSFYDKNEDSSSIMAEGIALLGKKFSALEVVATTALVRIANKAIDTGTTLVKSLSIDNVSAGYQKYEQQLTSMRTIMNATGQSADEVEAKLAKLSWYSDETSYSYENMLNTISTILSTGTADLDTAISMVIGMSNASAVAGASMDKSIYIYNAFSKAMSSGSLTLMQWQTLTQSANVITEDFKRSMIEAGLAVGTLEKKLDKVVVKGTDTEVTLAGLQDTLSKDWFTNEAMAKFLKTYSEYSDEIYNVVASDKGSQVFDEAAEIFQNGLNTILSSYADAMESNNISDSVIAELEKFDSITDDVKEKIIAAGLATGQFIKDENDLVKALDGTTISTENFYEALKNGAITAEMYTNGLKAGTYYTAYIAEAEKIAAEESISMSEALTKAATTINKIGKKGQEAAQEAKTFSDAINSVKQAVSGGFKSAFQTLFGNVDEAKTLWTQLSNVLYDMFVPGVSAINDILEEWKDLGGRDLLFNFEDAEKPLGALWNLLNFIQEGIDLIKEAFNEIIPPATAETLLTLSEKFQQWTETLVWTEERAFKLQNVIKGIASILKVVWGVVSNLWNSLIKPLASWGFDMIVDIASAIGYFANSIREGIKDLNVLKPILEYIRNLLKSIWGFLTNILFSLTGTKTIGELIMKVADKVKMGLEIITNALNKSREAMEGENDVESTGIGNFIGGLFNMLKSLAGLVSKLAPYISSIFNGIAKIISDIGGRLTDIDPNGTGVTGIIVELITSLLDLIQALMPIITKFIKLATVLVEKLTNFIANFNLRSLVELIIAAFPVTALFLVIKTFTTILGGLKSIKGLLDGFSSIGDALYYSGISKKLKAIGLMLLMIGIAFGIVAYSIRKLGEMDGDAIIRGTIVFGIFAAAVIGILLAVESFAKAQSKEDKKTQKAVRKMIGSFVKLAFGIVLLSVSFLIFAKAIQTLGSIDEDISKIGFTSILIITAGLLAVAKISEKIKMSGLIKLSLGMLLFASALLSYSYVMSQLGGSSWEIIKNMAASMATMLIAVVGIIAISSLSKKINLTGIIKLTAALLLLALAVKGYQMSISKIGSNFMDNIKEMAVAFGTIAAATLALILVSKLASKIPLTGLLKLSLGMLLFATALLSYSYVIKQLGGSSWEIIKNMLASMGAMLIAVGGIIAISSLAKKINLAGIFKFTSAMLLLALAVLGYRMSISKIGSNFMDNIKEMVVAFGTIALATLGLILISKLASKISLTGLLELSVSMLLLSGAILLFAAAMKMIKDIDVKAMLSFAASIAIIMAVFVAIGIIAQQIPGLTTVLEGFALVLGLLGAALLFAGLGVKLFAEGMAILASIDSKGIERIADVLDTLSKKMVSFVKAITKGIIEAIFDAIDVILDKLPTIVDKLGATLSSILQVVFNALTSINDIWGAIATFLENVLNFVFDYIGNNSGRIVNALISLVVSLLKGLANNASKIVTELSRLIVNLLSALGGVLEPILNALIKLVVDLLNALANSIEKGIVDITKAITNVFVSLIRGVIDSIVGIIVGIFEGALDIVNDILDSVVRLIAEIINAVADFIRSGSTIISDAIADLLDAIIEAATNFIANGNAIEFFVKLGKAIVQGLFEGIKQGWAELKDGFSGIFAGIGKMFEEDYKIHSPSKVFEEYGYYIEKGLANGLTKYSSLAENAMDDMIDGVDDKTIRLAKVMSAISEAVDGNMDIQPTIRPVVDISGIQEGANKINGLFGDSMYQLNGSYGYVQATATNINRRSASVDVPKPQSKDTSPIAQTTNNNTFNINGSNPKEVAFEVSKILQDQSERRTAVWAR